MQSLPGNQTPLPAKPGIQPYNGIYRDVVGTTEYTLYKSSVPRKHPPLFLMLHGGGQTASGFAEITQMQELLHQTGGLALFPAQSLGANPLGCWNWYHSQHQGADRGEPAMLAGLTRFIMEKHGVDRRRVYVAGMSAGGAMAAILGQAYPRLYAAVGVHSGLPTGIAHDVMSAMRAMSGGPPLRRPAEVQVQTRRLHAVPTIVFHGDCDRTVHPSNATAVIAQALGFPHGAAEQPPAPATQAAVAASPDVTLTKHARCLGRPDAELWMVHGCGHAWTGGTKKGSSANSSQPNASREMLRFFLSQSLTLRLPSAVHAVE